MEFNHFCADLGWPDFFLGVPPLLRARLPAGLMLAVLLPGEPLSDVGVPGLIAPLALLALFAHCMEHMYDVTIPTLHISTPCRPEGYCN